MRVLVYEFFSGGGLWHCPGQPPTQSLLAEGAAMLAAVAADFMAIAEVEVLTIRDARWAPSGNCNRDCTLVGSAAEELEALRRLTIAADWTLLIAPETGGMLLDRCRLVESAGGRLLSPPAKCVEIAASKQRTSELLERGGVRVPRGRLLSQWDHRVPPEFPMPAVIKPDEGCGSLGVRLVCQAADLRNDSVVGDIRLEEFIAGLPASVAVICGPAGNHALPACEQRLSADGTFAYRGGRLPLAPQLDARARRLALAAIAAMPQPRGYLGIDLVLGEAEDGSGDCVIEINPRLTTSYIGLRAAADTNLAAAMLDIANGRQPDLCFGPGPVEFTADGTIL